MAGTISVTTPGDTHPSFLADQSVPCSPAQLIPQPGKARFFGTL